jgi:hypothetical protein
VRTNKIKEVGIGDSFQKSEKGCETILLKELKEQIAKHKKYTFLLC